MKRILSALIVLSFVATGCQTYHGKMARNACQSCGPGQASRADHVPQIPIHQRGTEAASGPATGTYAYPYYTTRAPRDFFMDNPASIGP